MLQGNLYMNEYNGQQIWVKAKTFLLDKEDKIVERFNSPKLPTGSPWVFYKLLNILMTYLIIIAFPLIGISVFIHLIFDFQGKLDFLPVGLMFGTFILAVFLGIQLRSFRCPRCGKHFEWGYSKIGYPFHRGCLHCGLPRWQEWHEPNQKESDLNPVPVQKPGRQINITRLTRKLLRLAAILWIIFIVTATIGELSRYQ